MNTPDPGFDHPVQEPEDLLYFGITVEVEDEPDDSVSC